MQKIIIIGGKEVLLDNNVGWALCFREQFGQDIIPVLMPMAAAALDIVSDLIKKTGKEEGAGVKEILAELDGEAFINALIHLSGLEFTDLLRITWSMAKTAKPDIPPLENWIKQFDTFWLDDVAPEVFGLAFRGVVSSKNVDRLKSLMTGLRPELTLIPSSSPDLNEA